MTDIQPALVIRPYAKSDRASVIDLWKRCDLVRPQNNPEKDIARKLKVNPELFLVGTVKDTIVATVMGGYEGHRGWANYLAVEPKCRAKGYGRQILTELEDKLLALGCPKINLQVHIDNRAAILFYTKIGYNLDQVMSFGKRLIED